MFPKNSNENIISSFTPFPVLHPTPRMPPPHSLTWMASHYLLDCSGTCTCMPTRIQMKRVSKLTETKQELRSLHCICKQRCHWSLCGRPGTHPLNPSTLNTFSFHQTRESALMHPSVLCGNLVSLVPSCVFADAADCYQAWACAKPVLYHEPHPQTLFLESVSPCVAQAVL